MIWDGENIYTVQAFRPETIWSVDWHKVSDSNYKGSDRGSGEDIYMANIMMKGEISDLITLETVLNDNRIEFDITFSEGEEIFGMDVDYSSPLTVQVLNYGKITERDFNVYQMPLKLILNETPSFISSTPSLSALRKATHRDVRESDFDITRAFTYDRASFVTDHYSSSKQGKGIYQASFSQTNAEMNIIRRYLMGTARAATIVFPDFDDMDYPFGSIAGTGPFNVKVIDWSDGGRSNSQEWKLNIKFARVFS